MPKIHKITTKSDWEGFCKDKGFDLYHTYSFHQAHAPVDGGEPILWCIHLDNDFIAYPLLERNITNTEFKDATSVYGYSGPITNITSTSKFKKIFDLLVRYLKETEKYVSIFSRLNTLTTPKPILDECFIKHGKTINIDLTLSDAEQLSRFRSNHRRDIKKLSKNGFECSFISIDDGLDDFVRVYNSTMNALGASQYYFFPEQYYVELFENNHSDIKLVQCVKDNEVACMGIFSFTNGISQYHLGGTAGEFYRFAPTKLMFNFVREYANSIGCHSLHLGGGLGGGEDNLFNFKLGFSDDVKSFYVCKKILNENVYRELSKNKQESQYFPLYRS